MRFVRRFFSVVILLTTTLCWFACTTTTSESSSNPKGILNYGGVDCYAINLKNEQLTKYFTLIGSECQIAMSYTGLYQSSPSKKTEVISYCSARINGQTGTVIYRTNQTGLIIYLPNNFPEKHLRNVCSSYYLGLIDESMSIQEAEKYISSLN